MPPVATVGDSGMLSSSRAGGYSGMGGGRHSPVGGSNTRPVSILGCLGKELLG